MNLTGSARPGSNLAITQQPSSPEWGFKAPLWGAVLMAICPVLIFQPLSEDPWIVPRVFLLTLAVLWISLTSHKLNKPLLTKPIIIFLGAMLLTTVTSIDPLVSIFGQFYSPFHGLFPMLLCALVYFAFSTTNIPIEKFGSAILYTSIAISLWAIAQKWKQVGLQDGRAASGFGSPVYLGNYISLIIPLAWIWMRENRRYLGSIALIFAIMSAIAARARGGAAAGIAGIMVFEYLQGNKKQVYWSTFALLLLVLIAHPFHHDSDMGRIEMWKIAFKAWLDRPWFGYGPDTYGLIFRRYETSKVVDYVGNYKLIALQAHNDFLQILSTMGLYGLLAYVFLMGSIIKLLWDRQNRVVTSLMTAVWCQAQVNPVHIIILCYLAAFLGTERSDSQIKYRKMFSSSMCMVSLMLCFFAFEECRAVACESKAVSLGYQTKYIEATKMLHEASVAAPWEIHFQQRELNALWTVVKILDRRQLGDVADLSMTTAREAVFWHPNDPTAHDIAAHALKTVAMFKGFNTLKQSEEHMSIANKLAPTFKDYSEDLQYIKHEN